MGREVLVSACLLGRNCRFDGKSRLNKSLIKFLKKNGFIPLGVCPEESGGLKGKRGPFEFKGKAKQILEKKGEVKDSQGRVFTSYFLKGAYKVLALAKKKKIEIAILKSRSPSCSPDYIYDGTFKKVIKKGLGVSAYLLKKNTIKIFSESNYKLIKSESRSSKKGTKRCSRH
ncbi:MAG TPA: DUF523 domain-containing protein [Candidatus Omnitrophica bacterium]|nr:DUF523 domain-containing protein [Candidatus Omnitrophota bacterium]